MFLRLAERFNLSDFAYAHRGYWTEMGPPENSLEAFAQASALGLGIELDLRPSSDGEPMVFHDPVLNRMTESDGVLEEYTSTELSQIPLKGEGEIPSLDRLLKKIDPATPLLCELKIDGRTDPISFTRRVAADLAAHKGCAAMMSFSAHAVSAIPDSIMRGRLLEPSAVSGDPDLSQEAIKDVDYIACHISDAKSVALQTVRKHRPLIVWTVRDSKTCNDLAAFTDAQIFEGFDPSLAKRHIVNR